MRDYEEIISTLLAKIAELEEIVKQQATRIVELERRLSKNSSNSSKPPSSDGLKKPPRTSSLREKGKHKSGGQPGHKGETLKQVETPDIIKKHRLSSCPGCEKSLVLSPIIKLIKRQVFDIPVPKIQVTEHQAEVKYCDCCNKMVTALFPDKITAQVQYGEIIRSWCVYYQYQHFIPEDRLQQLFKDMYGVSLATASISNYNNTAYQALEGFEKNILSMAKTAQVKHLDETGFRVGGKTQWLHTLSTNTLTYYHVSPKRKSLIDGLEGIVVHDHWRPYYQIPDVKHALCNQHHLRELKALIEHDRETWARKMYRLLRIMLRYRHYYGGEVLPSERYERLLKLYERILQEGFDYHKANLLPAIKKRRGRVANRPGHNLLIRLSNYREDVLHFLHAPEVPFTNNEAERDLRMMKCKQKISGGFRSAHGANQFARIRGFINTMRKQGLNVLKAIQSIFSGDIMLAAGC